MRANVTVDPITVSQDSYHYRVQPDGHASLARALQFRVNSAQGVQDNQVLNFGFNSHQQKLTVREVRHKGRDGRWHAVPPANIRIVTGAEAGLKTDMLDIKALQVSLPWLVIGDSVRVKFDTAAIRPDAFGNHFYATHELPIGFASKAMEITVDAPASMPIRSVARGFVTPGPSLVNDMMRYQWRAEAARNDRLEFEQADRSASARMVRLSDFDDYAALARAYDSQYRPMVQADKALSALATSLVEGLQDSRAKTLAIYRWVQANVKYRALYKAYEPWLPHPAWQTLQRRQGDCKDHAVLLETMLAAVGVDSTPAMVNLSADIFSLPEVPTPESFDHVITYIPSQHLYLDAATKFTVGEYLAASELDKPTLLVKSGTIGHTPIHQPGRKVYRSEVRIGQDGSARTRFSLNADGYFAGEKADDYGKAAKYWLGKTVENFVTRLSLPQVPTSTDFSEPKEAGEQSVDYHFESVGHLASFLPAIDPPTLAASSSLMNEIAHTVAAYGIEQKRSKPFVCNDQDIQETETYILPDDLEYAAIPEDVHIADAFISYHTSYRREGQALTIERHLRRYKAESQVCMPQDFDIMRPTIEAMQRDVGQRIPLRRRT
ncbi:DUF3857 domain-containing protein [Chitinimonas naiadis]